MPRFLCNAEAMEASRGSEQYMSMLGWRNVVLVIFMISETAFVIRPDIWCVM